MQYQRRNHGHGFHHDAVGNHGSKTRYAIVIGEAQSNTDSEDQRHVSKNRTACFGHHVKLRLAAS
jgi:hypothetical protein